MRTIPSNSLDKPISREVALQICFEIREEKRQKLFRFPFGQCWGCMKFSEGDPDKMCLSSQPDYRGCTLVNARYAQKLAAAPGPEE